MKKIIALTLCLAIILAFGTSAFAAKSETDEMAKLTISGVVGTPDANIQAHVAKFQELYPGVEVEFITTDNNTREQIHKNRNFCWRSPNYWILLGYTFKCIFQYWDVHGLE